MGGGDGVTGGGGAKEWSLFPPSATLSVARSESLGVKSVVLPPSVGRRAVGNRKGEWWITEVTDGVGVGRRVFWSFSGDAEVSSVDLRVKSPNTMIS